MGLGIRFLARAALFAASLAPLFPAQGAGLRDSAKKAEEGSATPQRRQQLQSEQRQLQQRLSRLKKQLSDAEASHSEVADALSDSEQAISAANRRLRELAESRRQVERQIANAQDRGRLVGARQSEQELVYGRLARAQFALSRIAPWQQWLEGQPNGALTRDFHLLELAANASARSVQDLRERREELHQIEAESLVKQAELAGIAQEEKQARATLVRQQAARKQTLAKLSRQIGDQRQTIASLERDEKRLTSLVEELTRLLAEQARKAEQARRAAAAAAATAKNKPPAPADIEPPSGSKVAALRGNLHWPVKGDVVARFGAPRKTEAGVNAPTWKGILIRAPQGTDVRAVAAGRVVFADWLRGFGNLLIVDHGDGLLSVYGNNESLLRSVGERVEADDVIAAVGNTGGNAEAGLYFELRFEGRPIDPLKWAQAR